MSKHWIDFLDNGNKIFLNGLINLLSEHNLLTKEDKETIRSVDDCDRIRETLYWNYFEKYENEINGECKTPVEAKRFIRNHIIPRMKQDKIAAAIKKLEAQKEEIQKKIDALKGNFDTKPVEKIDFKLPVKAQDDSSLDIEKSRNEGYKFAKIFMPPLPAPEPPQSELKNDLQELFDIKDDFNDKVPTGKYETIDDVIKSFETHKPVNKNEFAHIDSLMKQLYKKPFGTMIPLKDFDDEELE